MDPAVSCLSTTFSGLHIHGLPFSSLKASCLLLPQDLCTYHFSFLNVLLLPAPASVCSPFRAQLNHCLPHKILSHLPHCIMAPFDSSSWLFIQLRFCIDMCMGVQHLLNKQANKSFPPGRILSLTTHSYFCLFSGSS